MFDVVYVYGFNKSKLIQNAGMNNLKLDILSFMKIVIKTPYFEIVQRYNVKLFGFVQRNKMKKSNINNLFPCEFYLKCI